MEASKIKSFGTIPLYVLTATDEKRYGSSIKNKKLKQEMINAWIKMQQDFLLLPIDSKQILITNSGHYINREQPKVIEKNAINDMVNKMLH